MNPSEIFDSFKIDFYKIGNFNILQLLELKDHSNHYGHILMIVLKMYITILPYHCNSYCY